MLIKVCAFLFALFPLITYADPVDQLKECQSLKDVKKRLACFDDAAKLVISFDAASKESAKLREENERTQKTVEEAKKREELDRNKRAADDATMREPLTILMKLETRTSTGINSRDYSSALSDAKFSVRQLQGSPAATRRPLFVGKLNEIVRTYEDANDVWNVQINWKGRREINSDNSPVFTQVMAKYPTVRAAVRKNSDYVHFDTVISLIWDAARTQIAEAEKLFANEVK